MAKVSCETANITGTLSIANKASPNSINNKANAAFKSFRSMISHTDTTIKDKFQFCMDKYANEIVPLIEKYARIEGVDM